MCFFKIESEKGAQTIMFHVRPSPLMCFGVPETADTHWLCDESEKEILSVNLASFLAAHKLMKRVHIPEARWCDIGVSNDPGTFSRHMYTYELV